MSDLRGAGMTELDVAARVVELVHEIAGPAAEAEVTVVRHDLALTRFANSFIHQNVAESGVTVRLRVHVDGRTAAGGGSLVDPDGLRALVGRTLTAARLCPPDPAWPGLTPPSSVHSNGLLDEATAYAEPAARADRVRAFVDAVGGLEAAGYCRTSYRSGAFANSAGQSAQGRTTEAAMDGIARADGADGVARLCAGRLDGLDGAALGARAAAKARAAADPVELPPGRYQVVLEPAAVADLLQNLAWYGFNGKRHAERQSFARPGTAQFDPAVTLVDDPTYGATMPFDLEGTPRQSLTLVEAGTTRAVAHDRRSAAGAGTTSTGHGMPGGSTFGPIPHNVRLLGAAEAGSAVTAHAPTGGDVPGCAALGGTRAGSASAGGEAVPPGSLASGEVARGPAARGGVADGPAARGGVAHGPAARGGVADADTAELVAPMTRGLLVSDFWYTRVLDPKSLVITGLTRNGVWLVEDGVPVRAVRNFRFTEAYPRALGPGAVLGVGRRPVRQPDRIDGGWWEAPPLRLASWNFTGGASG